ncbi:MAG TPA: calcium-binding protein [Amaricoccus sp.]|uniref:calcium-binding protein n=1 Tax=Amaricoccus sp. TaxID=1872485 RepID=UPI002CE29727|nr:calcium-binding protein [Amaricoccus sp.]HMR54527.1 calcium-binding protein [Amaricoccus sp.]HMU01631.1 calcium-binding protein [Amaricoccus sp.]
MTTTPTSWGNEVTFSNLFTDFNPKVAALQDGTFTIVWQGDGGNLVGKHLNELGSFTGDNFLLPLSDSTAKPMSGPQVFQQSDGHIVVNYTEQFGTNDFDVRSHYVDRGNPHGYSAPLENSARNEFLLDSAAVPTGGSANVFMFNDAAGVNNICLRFVNSYGVPVSNSIIIGRDSVGQINQNATIEGLQSGAAAVAYEVVNTSTGAREIRLQVRDAEGNFETGVWQASTGDKNAAFPEIIELANGNFVVAWQQQGGLAFREFGTDLRPIEGAPTPIADSNGGMLPKMTALNDGGFMVAWTRSDGTEGDGSPELDVFAQRFDRNGNPIGNQIHIDKPGDQGLGSLDIATLADGRVIVTYGSETGDSTNITTLKYQIFDPRDPNITATNGDDNYLSRMDGATISGLNGNDKLTGMEGVDLLFGGNGNDNLIGNGNRDSLSGGAGNDSLDGGSGNDVLDGGAGNDIIKGGNGNDRIRGDAGADQMQGGSGADQFWFDDGHTGLGTAGRDRISDFSRSQGDKLDVDLIDANLNVAGDQDFVFKGTGAFTGIGQVRVVSSGADRILQFNNDTDMQADFEITLAGFNTNVLGSDFFHL